MNAATLQSCQIRCCTVHKEEALKLYCETCSELICRDCTLVKHRNHDFTFVQDARKKVNKKMLSIVSEVDIKQREFKHHLQEIKKVEGSVFGHLHVLKADINTFFDKLVKSIERRRKVLLQEAGANCQRDIEQIRVDKSFHERTITQMASVFALAQKAQKCTNDSEMILTALHTISLLKQLQQTKWDCRRFTNIVVSTPKFSPTDVTVQAIGTVDSVEVPTTNIECIDPPKKVQVGQTTTFKVKVPNSLINQRSGEPVYLQQVDLTDLKVMVHYGQPYRKRLDDCNIQITKGHGKACIIGKAVQERDSESQKETHITFNVTVETVSRGEHIIEFKVGSWNLKHSFNAAVRRNEYSYYHHSQIGIFTSAT